MFYRRTASARCSTIAFACAAVDTQSYDHRPVSHLHLYPVHAVCLSSCISDLAALRLQLNHTTSLFIWFSSRVNLAMVVCPTCSLYWSVHGTAIDSALNWRPNIISAALKSATFISSTTPRGCDSSETKSARPPAHPGTINQLVTSHQLQQQHHPCQSTNVVYRYVYSKHISGWIHTETIHQQWNYTHQYSQTH